MIWAAGLGAAIVFFAVVEGFALKHPDRCWTLSHWIALIGSRFPLSIWFMGIFAGGLAVHFFWHYCPDFAQQIGYNEPLVICNIDHQCGVGSYASLKGE